MKNIFIDFDGTIINDKKKQYKAFYKTVNTLNVHNDLDFETFLKLKSNHLSNYEVLQSVSKTSINKFEFNKIYKTHVEKIQLLYEDKLFEDALNLLKSIYEKGYKCYLVTNRQYYLRLLIQLKYLNINKFFHQVILSSKYKNKFSAINSESIPLNQNDIFISDNLQDFEEFDLIKIYLGNENFKNKKIIKVDSLTQLINLKLL